MLPTLELFGLQGQLIWMKMKCLWRHFKCNTIPITTLFRCKLWALSFVASYLWHSSALADVSKLACKSGLEVMVAPPPSSTKVYSVDACAAPLRTTGLLSGCCEPVHRGINPHPCKLWKQKQSIRELRHRDQEEGETEFVATCLCCSILARPTLFLSVGILFPRKIRDGNRITLPTHLPVYARLYSKPLSIHLPPLSPYILR